MISSKIKQQTALDGGKNSEGEESGLWGF